MTLYLLYGSKKSPIHSKRMLQTNQLNFSYDKKNQFQFPDIKCGAGENWLLLGQSGSGKTTLLHLLAGLLHPTSGKVEIGGTDTSTLSAGELDRFRGNKIGIVFQKPHFIKSLTVGENLALAQKLAGQPVDNQRIMDLLARLNIGEKINKKPQNLSQGEQQRASIARAVINRPALILADEPTSALDDLNTKEVIDLLEEQAAEVNATLLIVTHDSRLKDRMENRILI